VNRRPLTAWLAATIALGAARAFEMRLNAGLTGANVDFGSVGFIAGLAASAGIHAAIVVWLASRSRLPDPARVYALIVIGIGFVILNNIEAVVFDIAPPLSLAGLTLLSSLVHAAVVVGVARALPVRQDIVSGEPTAPWRLPRVILTFVLLGFLYAIVYFAAGAVIYPFVQKFYANKPLPSGGLILVLQAFVRGPLFVAIGAFVVRLVGPNRRTAALATACTLSGLGGLTALLVSNPLFPDDVRLVHLAEVGISNFVFGLIVGWVLSKR
jgi:hypothetical protein